MELRHLRYFVAVAEEGSLTVAAERRLHTAQPSLSRQLRALEQEVGAALLARSPRGVSLTPAGQVFLEHARLVLAQVETAREAVRRAVDHGRPSFALGFMTGRELDWLPAAMEMLQEELPRIRVTITSHYSPDLIEGLRRGALDAAFVRRPLEPSELAFKWLETEPLLAVLPGDHRLAAQPDIALGDLAGETFITVSRTAPTLQCVIAEALRSAGVALAPAHEVDHLTMAISLVASTRGVALLPRYALHFLPAAITSRPLRGAAPTIDLVLGWNPANRSPILRSFLARADGAIAGRARRHQTV